MNRLRRMARLALEGEFRAGGFVADHQVHRKSKAKGIIHEDIYQKFK